MKKFFGTLKFWFENARYHALGQSFWACLVSIFVAATYRGFNFRYAVIATIGVLLAHLSINLLDDYFDFKSGSVEKRNNLEDVVRTGKCTYLLTQKTNTKSLFLAAFVFALLAALLGFYLYLQRGIYIIVFAAIAAVLGFFYSAPPLKLSYHGLGEVVVGIMFGPLLMNGVFYCATGTISLQLLVLSFAIGSLVTNILYVHSIMDVKADSAVKKHTLAVLLKTKFLQTTALLFFAIYPYWLMIVGVWRYGMPKLSLLTLITLPLTVVLIKFMVEYLNGSTKKHEPRLWMGQMECWERISALGIDWFMIRWFLARNIMIYFSAFICIAYLLKFKGMI